LHMGNNSSGLMKKIVIWTAVFLVSIIAGLLFASIFHPEKTLPVIFFSAILALGAFFLGGYFLKLPEKVSCSKTDIMSSIFTLNPTFLFNTLHNITALNMADPELAGETTRQLADYMRLIMEAEKRQYTLVNQEIRCAELLLDIERKRLGSRFRLVRDLDPVCMEFVVPSLILQPFVMNAVNHGVETCAQKAEIILATYCDDQRVIIEISDTGKGLEIENLSKITSTDRSIGNVFRRLESLYGDNFELNIEALAPSGTRVRLSLPKMYQEI
jgi:LytS/YehU family sensor histidine kinase